MHKIECGTCGKLLDEDMEIATDHAIEHVRSDIYFRKEFGDSPVSLPVNFKRVTV